MREMCMSFGEHGGFKEGDLVCSCFGYTREDIRRDWLAHNGRSTILETILSEKKSGGCDCTQKNPKGR